MTGEASVSVATGLKWADSHCHLEHDRADGDADAAVADARGCGVELLIDVGVDAASSRAAVERARRIDGVWATAGVHPHEARLGLEGIEEMLAEPEVVAVGEAGLDYHYDHSPRDVQADVFAAQIGLANDHDLALVIHTRDAWDDTFAILDREGVPARTVFHCFTGGPEEALAGAERGIHCSFSGIVTFPSARDVRAAAAALPLDKILVETDSPYLAPVPHRGKPNAPSLVPLVGAAVAAERGASIGEIARATLANTHRVFSITASPA